MEIDAFREELRARGGESAMWLVYMADRFGDWQDGRPMLVLQQAFFTRGHAYAFAEARRKEAAAAALWQEREHIGEGGPGQGPLPVIVKLGIFDEVVYHRHSGDPQRLGIRVRPGETPGREVKLRARRRPDPGQGDDYGPAFTQVSVPPEKHV